MAQFSVPHVEAPAALEEMRKQLQHSSRSPVLLSGIVNNWNFRNLRGIGFGAILARQLVRFLTVRF